VAGITVAQKHVHPLTDVAAVNNKDLLALGERAECLRQLASRDWTGDGRGRGPPARPEGVVAFACFAQPASLRGRRRGGQQGADLTQNQAWIPLDGKVGIDPWCSSSGSALMRTMRASR